MSRTNKSVATPPPAPGRSVEEVEAGIRERSTRVYRDCGPTGRTIELGGKKPSTSGGRPTPMPVPRKTARTLSPSTSWTPPKPGQGLSRFRKLGAPRVQMDKGSAGNVAALELQKRSATG